MAHTLGELGLTRTKAGRRKLRLYACGCARLGWGDLDDVLFREAVEVAERFSDGLVTKADLATAHQTVSGRYFHPSDQHPGLPRLERAEYIAAETCLPQALEAAYTATVFPTGYEGSPEAESTGQLLCDLFRCVFGNPFCKPAFNKKWRTETVTALATVIYETRAFDRLPILADSLEEAGCDDPAMLSHLRGPNPHCRGC